MSDIKQKRTTIFILILLVLAGSFVTILAISAKKGMHVDEYYSYGLSNYAGDEIYMPVELGKTYEEPEEPFLSYMTAQPGARFAYENVWEKQTADVHPPFYYVILHTISSFFPGTFSIWYAGVINLFFFAGLIFLTYASMQLLTGSQKASLLAAMLCSLSAGMIQINTFLRMYTMLMFMTMLLTWLHLKYYHSQTARFFILYPLILIAGSLTHYYFLLFLLIQGLYFGVSLLLRRYWKNAAFYLMETLFAVGFSYLIFPAMGSHIFSGYRGKETLGNLAAPSGYLSGLWDFFKIIRDNLTGNILPLILLLFAGAYAYRLFTKKKLLPARPALWGMLFFSAAGAYLLISKMAVYHYDRYISPIYPVLILLIIGMIDCITKSLLRKKHLRLSASIMLTLACILPSYVSCDWTYLQEGTGAAVKAAKTLSDMDCVIVNHEVNFWNQTLYFEAQNYQSVTFLSDTQLNEYSASQVYQTKPIVVYIMDILDNQDEILRKMMQQNPAYTHYTQLPDSAYCKGYILE